MKIKSFISEDSGMKSRCELYTLAERGIGRVLMTLLFIPTKIKTCKV